MAIIDLVKYEAQDGEFVWKFPSEDLRIGTQLVVNISQTAFFVKGGKIYDQY
jgi:membrane protease subunit (stomatin/prohibitin family)